MLALLLILFAVAPVWEFTMASPGPSFCNGANAEPMKQASICRQQHPGEVPPHTKQLGPEQEDSSRQNRSCIEQPDHLVECLVARWLVERDGEANKSDERQKQHRPERIGDGEIDRNSQSGVDQHEHEERLVVVAHPEAGDHNGMENSADDKNEQQ